MKQMLLSLIFSFLFVASAWAAPFLSCAPQLHTTDYIVTVDGVDYESPGQDMGDNTVRLHFDLAGLSDGNHTCAVISKNIWGESEPVPFDFNKTVPECVSALEIIAQ